MPHICTHTLAWTWERVALGRRPSGCSAPLPHPSHFLISPGAASHPAPCTSARGSCTIPWELQMWPRITHSSEGSSDQKPSSSPQAYPTQAGSNPQPRVLVLDRDFLSFGFKAPRETIVNTNPCFTTQTHGLQFSLI